MRHSFLNKYAERYAQEQRSKRVAVDLRQDPRWPKHEDAIEEEKLYPEGDENIPEADEVSTVAERKQEGPGQDGYRSH